MASSSVTYISDGGTLVYSVPYPFILREHVKIYVDGALQTANVSYTWPSNSSVRFTVEPISGAVLLIRRETPLDSRLVTFTDGASLTESDLNLNTSQLLFGIQEAIDRFDSVVTGTYTDPSNALIASAASAVLTTEAALEVQARITDIDAAGQLLLEAMMQRRVLGEPTDDYSAFILDTNTTLVSPTESLATRLTTITASFASNAAAILSEQTARASADTAIATSVTNLSAVVTSNASTAAASVASEASTRASADTAIASSVTSLIATVATNTAGIATNVAAIATEASARATGDSANASDITALTSTVGGHTSTLTTLAATDVTLAGGITTLNARYGVALNVDGCVSGFTLNSSGGSGSSFDILTNKFRVVDPGPGGGATPVSVFTISGGNVYLQNLFIDGSLVVDGTLTAAKFSVSTLDAITANIGALNINSTGRLAVSKSNADDTSSGIWLGTDGSGDYDLNIGNATSYLHWDGSAGLLKLSPAALLLSMAGPFIDTRTITVGGPGAGSTYGYVDIGFGSISAANFIDGRLTLQRIDWCSWQHSGAATVTFAINNTIGSAVNDDRTFSTLQIGANTALSRSAASYSADDGFGNTAWTWAGVNTSGWPTSGTIGATISRNGLA